MAAELTLFRWCSHDVPFWGRENSRDGRFNRAGDGSTQYWSLSPAASWAELIRHEDLRTEAQLDLVRMPFWVCRIADTLLADLRDSAQRRRYRISEAALIDDDWSACQGIAQRLREHHRGVIAPSAALPGHANVTLFGRRRAIDYESAAALASAVPTARAAIGRPPEGLLERVRRRATRRG